MHRYQWKTEGNEELSGGTLKASAETVDNAFMVTIRAMEIRTWRCFYTVN